MLIKNVGLAAVDLGGLVLPPGATADVDPHDPVIAERLTAGVITPVQGAVHAEPGPELVTPPEHTRPTIPIPHQRTAPAIESTEE